MKKKSAKTAGPVMDIGISADDRAEIAAGLSRLLADSFNLISIEFCIFYTLNM